MILYLESLDRSVAVFRPNSSKDGYFYPTVTLSLADWIERGRPTQVHVDIMSLTKGLVQA